MVSDQVWMTRYCYKNVSNNLMTKISEIELMCYWLHGKWINGLMKFTPWSFTKWLQ